MHVVMSGHGEPLNSALARWVSDRIWPGQGKEFGPCMAVGVFDEARPMGAMLWHDWNPDAGVMEFSAAADDRRWLTRRSLAAIFGYPFDEVGCQMVVCKTSATARQAHLHRMFRAYGFDLLRVPRLYGRDEDGMVCTLTEERWRANGFHTR